MKKVIYIPRRKGTGSFNVRVEAGAGSFLYSTVLLNNRPFMPFEIDISGYNGVAGFISYTGFNQSSNKVIVNTALEVFMYTNRMLQLLNNVGTDSNIGLWATTGMTPFTKPFTPTSVSFYPELSGRVKFFKPIVERVSRQNVFVEFSNIANSENQSDTANLLFFVNRSHFNSGISDAFFSPPGIIGGGYSGGTSYLTNDHMKSWRNLMTVLEDGLKNYFNVSTNFFNDQAAMSPTCHLYFSQCLSNTNFTDGNGVNYQFTQTESNAEALGIDVNRFNAVINI